MLHLNDLTLRIEGRLLLEEASVGIPSGHKVGLVGRNGTGKTTLIKAITGEIAPDSGEITTPRNTRLGWLAQEAPGGSDPIIDYVLSGDEERTRLLAAADSETDPFRIAEIHVRLADIDAHGAPSRAARILAGLGFDALAQKRGCGEFSAGWRMRISLARLLFSQPDVLLLDEPTNYLDLEGTLWLEDYLARYPGTVLIVSHDRDLLNRSVNAILHLHQRKLTLYTGGYDRFEETRRQRQELDLKLKKRQDDERRRIEAFINRFKAKASKATQAQSRMKALARMQPIAEQIEDRVAPFLFESPLKPMASPLVRLEAASVGYGAGPPVLRGLDLRLDRDDRLGLLGQNGNGKSTLARLIAGRLGPMSGRRLASDKMIVGYFAQHQMDDLPAAMSPYDHMLALMPDATEAQRRAKLGTLGFGADLADSAAHKLSGGEKARLLLALATFHRPHLLILDEPTNHLDVDAREALIRALGEFEGAVILISHDRHLIEASVDRLWIARGGTAGPYEGDLSSYQAECLAEPEDERRGSAAKTPERPSADPKEARRAAAERRAAIAPLKRQVEAAERKLEAIAAEIKAIDAKLGDGKLYANGADEAQKLAAERGRLGRALSQAEDAWLAASEAYDTAREGSE